MMIEIDNIECVIVDKKMMTEIVYYTRRFIEYMYHNFSQYAIALVLYFVVLYMIIPDIMTFIIVSCIVSKVILLMLYRTSNTLYELCFQPIIYISINIYSITKVQHTMHNALCYQTY